MVSLRNKQKGQRKKGITATKLLGGTLLFAVSFMLFNVYTIVSKKGHAEAPKRSGQFARMTRRQEPQQQPQSPPLKPGQLPPPDRNDEDAIFHLILSTGCSKKQDWQSFVFFHSVVVSGQLGHVTRIASGCKDDQEARALQEWHEKIVAPMRPGKFHLHLTPDFSKIKEGVKFHYFNKPFATHHWLESALGYNLQHKNVGDNPHDDTIVLLFDPDQIILRPFTNDYKENEIWRTRTTHPIRHSVSHGYPMAQEYGFATQWKTKTNISRTAPQNELPSPVQTMSQAEAEENYAVGPPYIATARDFYKIVTKWKDFVPFVHEDYPHLLAEMFAYCLAAAHLNLPHQVAWSFMISDVGSPRLEGWGLLSSYGKKDVCSPGRIPREVLPHVLHYCHRYTLGKFVIGKHRVPHDFISCESPLFTEPPPDIAEKYDFFVEPDKEKDVRSPIPARIINDYAFMLCTVLPSFNRAAMYYKEHYCQNAPVVNTEKSLVFFKSMEIDPSLFQPS